MEQAETREPTAEDDPGIDRRSRRAFTISLAVVALVVAVALGYSFFRDPGPQPTHPPKITGTDDGGLKRAIVHYVGALESRDVDVLTDLMADASARNTALATAAIDEFGDAAQKPAKAKVTDSDGFQSLKYVTLTFDDGRVQQLTFTSDGPDSRWIATPRAD